MDERAGEDGPKGAGYAVLWALINGDSPSTIAGDQGKKMAEAAADARAERETGKPETAGEPENARRPEHAGGGRPDGADRGKP